MVRLLVGAGGFLLVGIGLGIAIAANVVLWQQRERRWYVEAQSHG
jgi:hypothetical protein